VSARESGSASSSTPLLPEEYDSLIERLRETAEVELPRNATVLVISRGDDELLRMGPRRAMHFPQDEFGRYPGYHPEDSEAAIALLENMRARGAEYLLLPSTAFWWLDYYEELREHLERNYSPVLKGDDCMIFDLAPTDVQAPEPDADTSEVSAATSSRRLARPLDEFLQALLPDDARIAVVAGSDGDLPSFGDCTAVPPPDNAGGLSALLDEARAGGAEFLVIPATAYERVHGEDEPAHAVGSWRLVTRQRYLCEVYERDLGQGKSQGAGRRPAANGVQRMPDVGFWGRIRNFFRRG
jgi:hypothetical protein